jgi:hypothetical protein
MQEERSRRTALYRIYDDAGVLLYVGISGRPWARLSEHRRSSDWYDGPEVVRIEYFPSRPEALKAEAEAIRGEAPRHNVLGQTVPLHPETPGERLAAEARIEAYKTLGRASLFERVMTGHHSDRMVDAYTEDASRSEGNSSAAIWTV